MRQIIVAASAFLFGVAHVAAQPLPKTHVTVVGVFSPLQIYREYEVPLWTKTLPAKSGGSVTAAIKAVDEMGLKGGEVLSLMGQGIIQAGAAVMAYHAGEDPMMEAVDIAGILPDIETARKGTKASMPMYEKLYAEKFGVKLLAIAPHPAQIIMCKGEVKSYADLRGKKVRVHGRPAGEFVSQLGATPITIPFGEVLPAMQNNAVDCAVSGAMSAHLARWYEVATHMLTLPMGWGQISYAVGAQTWNGWHPGVRQLIGDEIAALEESLWVGMGRDSQLGVACNAGLDTCPLATRGKMKIVEPTEADRKLLHEIATTKLLPGWAKRCSAKCVAAFNETMGKALDITVQR